MKERLSKLYENGTLGEQQLLTAVQKGWISVEDATSIVGAENSLPPALRLLRLGAMWFCPAGKLVTFL